MPTAQVRPSLYIIVVTRIVVLARIAIERSKLAFCGLPSLDGEAIEDSISEDRDDALRWADWAVATLVMGRRSGLTVTSSTHLPLSFLIALGSTRMPAAQLRPALHVIVVIRGVTLAPTAI
jgi:hypothetical protein